PKGMRHKTYERLQSAALSAEILAQERLAIFLERVKHSERPIGRSSRRLGKAQHDFPDDAQVPWRLPTNPHATQTTEYLRRKGWGSPTHSKPLLDVRFH